jgi:hypothetical protein
MNSATKNKTKEYTKTDIANCKVFVCVTTPSSLPSLLWLGGIFVGDGTELI